MDSSATQALMAGTGFPFLIVLLWVSTGVIWMATLGQTIGSCRIQTGESLSDTRHKGNPGAAILRALAMGLLCWATLGRFHSGQAVAGLDTSWKMVLEHATTLRWGYGTDIVFTYGPLGPFSQADLEIGLGGLRAERFAFAAWAASFLSASWARWSAGVSGGAAAFLWMWLLIGPTMALPYAMIASAVWHLHHQEGPAWLKRLWAFGLAPIALALCALVKFTYFLSVVAVLLVGTLLKPWRTLRPGDALPAVVTGLVFLAGWWLAGQPWTGLRPWIGNGLAMSAAYADGMQILMVPPTVLWLAAIQLLLVLFCLGGFCWGNWRRKQWASIALASSLAGLVALVWKHGVSRADDGHVLFFLWTTPILVLLLWRPSSGFSSRLHRAGSIGVALVSLLAFSGLVVTAGVAPWTLLTDALHARMAGMVISPASTVPDSPGGADIPSTANQILLPKLREALSDRPVDIFNFEQSIAFSNALNYRPRPVFQSYAAGTRALAALNSDWWKGHRKDLHLLLRVESIDGRLPTSEDALCWPEWLTTMEPLQAERNFLLLGPRSAIVDLQWEKLDTGTSPLSGAIPVPPVPPGSLLRLKLEPHRSLWGNVVKGAFQPEALHLKVRLESGVTKKWRIVPEMVRAGVLIEPLVESAAEVLAFFADDETLRKRPAEVWLETENGRVQEWAPSFSFQWEQSKETYLPDVRSARIAREAFRQLQFEKGFQLMQEIYPDSALEIFSADLTRQTRMKFKNKPALRVDAPSRIVIGARAGRFEGNFAMLEEAWKHKKPSDGVTFVVAAANSDGMEHELFRRRLDPARVELDRGWQDYSVEVPTGFSWLILRTDGGPTQDQDRAVWGPTGWRSAERSAQ